MLSVAVSLGTKLSGILFFATLHFASGTLASTRSWGISLASGSPGVSGSLSTSAAGFLICPSRNHAAATLEGPALCFFSQACMACAPIQADSCVAASSKQTMEDCTNFSCAPSLMSGGEKMGYGGNTGNGGNAAAACRAALVSRSGLAKYAGTTGTGGNGDTAGVAFVEACPVRRNLSSRAMCLGPGVVHSAGGGPCAQVGRLLVGATPRVPSVDGDHG
mmetsp:Transcript_64019/g.169529  ORF Transcript_64019/g.169529 Transcript_64019/m.169529 type:complete len:219 (-) Transcript_64019:1310-1966(-)